MVMQFLGLSLEKLLHSLPQKVMTVPTVCMVGIQIVNIIQSIHNQHYIHRDIKPDNFVIGIGNENTKLYIIDFGLGKLYRNPLTMKHNPYSVTTKLIGTVRYASVNSLLGTEQSRRDDLESVAYVLIYLLKGKLPWQGLVTKRKEDKYVKVLEKKRELSPQELCMGLPSQIEKFLIYVKSLGYEEQPNYQMMVDLLKECFNDYKTQQGDDVSVDKPFVFDWIKKNRRSLTNIKESKSLKLQMKLEENTIPTTTKPVKYATPDRVPTRKEIKQNGEDISVTEKPTAINNYIKPKNVILKRSNITTQSKKEKDSVNKEQTLVATVACTKTTQIPNYKKVSSNNIGPIQQKTTPNINEVNMNKTNNNSNTHNHKKRMCVSKCCIIF
jgi:serine/threonine protein kinase